MNKLVESLELDKVLQDIATFCGMESSLEEIRKSEVIFNPLVINRRLTETKEATALLAEGKEINFGGIRDVRELLQKTTHGQILTTPQLQSCLSFHHHCARLTELFRRYGGMDTLKDYTDSLQLDERTYRTIESIVDQNGKMKKTASKKLAALYESSDEAERELSRRAKTFVKDYAVSLQEDVSYYRNNRLTFLVRNSDKNKFEGFKYGESSSGQAAYVEPAEFVELNNKHLAYQEDIEKEILRILKEASAKIALSADLYYRNYESLEYLDIIFAKAKYGYNRKACIPVLIREGEMVIRDIAHPLLPAGKVVRNSYRFVMGKKGIVISGSNTGGKTISLKVIGLAVLMTYLGIPLLAESAFVPLFDQLFVDIQDEQSIASSLSTFSAHLINLRDIFRKATKQSLVLIDELATGTDPREAEALSLSILDRFQQMDVHFILTTHYEAIKQYAFEADSIMLSSVGFDAETLSPTYRYQEDVIGSSNALAIAGKYLEDAEIIARANDYLKQRRSKEEKLLLKLTEREAELEKQQEQFLAEREAFLQRENEVKQREANLIRRQEELESTAKAKLDTFITEKMCEIEDIVERYKKDSVLKKAQIPNIEKQLRAKNTLKETKVNTVNEPLREGDRVRIKGSERVGLLTSLQQDRGILTIGKLNINVKLRELEKLPPLTVRKEMRVRATKHRISSELNLVGMRVDEALSILEKYLDEAYATGMANVKIIHGFGTMALKNACRDYLHKISSVASFKDGDYYDGGGAVTMVVFKNALKG